MSHKEKRLWAPAIRYGPNIEVDQSQKSTWDLAAGSHEGPAIEALLLVSSMILLVSSMILVVSSTKQHHGLLLQGVGGSDLEVCLHSAALLIVSVVLTLDFLPLSMQAAGSLLGFHC